MTGRHAAILATLALSALAGFAGWLVGVPLVATATLSGVAAAVVIRRILRPSVQRSAPLAGVESGRPDGIEGRSAGADRPD